MNKPNIESEICIDQLDAKIIGCLQKDGRMSYTTIAKILSISEATVRTRVNKLQKDGDFQIVAVCDPQKIGFAITGNIWLDVDIKKLDKVIDNLKNIEEIWYISLNTGRIDINIVFNVNSLKELENLIYQKINKIDGVKKAESSIIVSYKKRLYHWGTGLSDKAEEPQKPKTPLPF